MTRSLVTLLVACSAASARAAPSPCAQIPHSDHPHIILHNDVMDAVIFLPDAHAGYYRGSRFDWAGLVACASYQGHTYFGEWTGGYDPLRGDAVVGPVEEFRAQDGAEPGYADAVAGGTFVKPGVGLLRKPVDAPYRFGAAYPIVDGGIWKVRVRPRSVEFTQRLATPLGYAYLYRKTLTLDRHKPILRLTHSLKNLGARPLETNVYDHDFFVFDGQPVEAGDRVTFGFAPQPVQPLGTAATLAANTITFTQTPARTATAQGYLTGYTGTPGEYRIEVASPAKRMRILQRSQSPISRSYFWSTALTICPELYIPIQVYPRATQRWSIEYELGTLR